MVLLPIHCGYKSHYLGVLHNKSGFQVWCPQYVDFCFQTQKGGILLVFLHALGKRGNTWLDVCCRQEYLVERWEPQQGRGSKCPARSHVRRLGLDCSLDWAKIRKDNAALIHPALASVAHWQNKISNSLKIQPWIELSPPPFALCSLLPSFPARAPEVGNLRVGFEWDFS